MKETHKEASLVEQTQDRILQYIAAHNYELNTVLPKEHEMAEALGVSRVVIREAYSGLRSLGFLETKRKKGTVLISPKVFGILKYIVMSGLLDPQSIEDLYELRLMLEIGMVDFIMEGRSEEKLNQLMEIVQQEEECEDSSTLKSLDIRFHTILYGMSGNKSLQYFQHLLSQLFNLYTPRSANWRSHEMMTHRTLVHFLKKGDVNLFRSAMRIHLENQFINKKKNLMSMQDHQEEVKTEE
ncbi:MAG: FadR/GntR family transcriptional regulator [Phocaeicola sp.]